MMVTKNNRYWWKTAVVVSCLIATACSQPEDATPKKVVPQTTSLVVATTSTTTLPPLSESYPNLDWRYVDYVFFFLQQETGTSKFEQALRSVEDSLSSEHKACLTKKDVQSFDLAKVARALDNVVKSGLDGVQQELLRTRLVSGAPTAANDGFDSFVFPSIGSPVRKLLKWWLANCGDSKRGTVQTVATTVPRPSANPSNTDAPKTCRYYWQTVGEQYLPSRCAVVSMSNCRITFQEKIWDPISSSTKIRSQYTLDVKLKDGTEVLAVRYTFMTPCS